MEVGKNRQQAEVDAVVKAAKARRQLKEIAERALSAPETLSSEEIKRISAFVIEHVE